MAELCISWSLAKYTNMIKLASAMKDDNSEKKLQIFN